MKGAKEESRGRKSESVGYESKIVKREERGGKRGEERRVAAHSCSAGFLKQTLLSSANNDIVSANPVSGSITCCRV